MNMEDLEDLVHSFEVEALRLHTAIVRSLRTIARMEACRHRVPWNVRTELAKSNRRLTDLCRKLSVLYAFRKELAEASDYPSPWNAALEVMFNGHKGHPRPGVVEGFYGINPEDTGNDEELIPARLVNEAIERGGRNGRYHQIRCA